jgi:hypothetical protein
MPGLSEYRPDYGSIGRPANPLPGETCSSFRFESSESASEQSPWAPKVSAKSDRRRAVR